jgi:hypothetical protein
MERNLHMTLLYETLCGEDLELGTGTTTKTNPGGGTLPGTQVSISTLGLNGAGTQATTQVWAPGAIAAGQSVSVLVTVQGALTSDFAIVSHDGMGANNLEIGAFVQAANTVRVVMSNPTASAITPSSGTLRVLVLHLR